MRPLYNTVVGKHQACLPYHSISESSDGISPYDLIINNNIALRDLISVAPEAETECDRLQPKS